MTVLPDWMNPDEPERPPRGNGVNVHLKGGGYVYVQENQAEVRRAWIDARREDSHRQGQVMQFTGERGKRVTLAPEDVNYLEEL